MKVSFVEKLFQFDEFEDFQVYLVGGAVRDSLLHVPVRERDWVVVGATPEKMQSYGFQPVGSDFPVFLHPRTKEEYALARTERKSGKGYKGFVCDAAPYVTLEQDLERRDLTINAMAQDKTGRIIDPFGGQTDLEKKVLRHVSPAFIEDPVRVLRAARFYARFYSRGFCVAEETLKLMRQMVTMGELDALVSERVWQEMFRALSEPTPTQFFLLLRQVGALRVVFPELDQSFEQKFSYGDSDAGLLCLQRLAKSAEVSADVISRFSLLVCQLDPFDATSNLQAISAFCKRLKLPKAYQEFSKLLAKHYLFVKISKSASTEAILRFFEGADAFRRAERFEKLLQALEILENMGDFEEGTVAYLRGGYRALNEVEFSAQDSGLSGVEIGKHLRALRVAAWEAYLGKL